MTDEAPRWEEWQEAVTNKGIYRKRKRETPQGSYAFDIQYVTPEYLNALQAQADLAAGYKDKLNVSEIAFGTLTKNYHKLCIELAAANDLAAGYKEARDYWRRIAEGSDSYVRTVTDKLREQLVAAENLAAGLRAALDRWHKAIFVHVNGTHFWRKCRLCGRVSYEDGSMKDGKPIHADWCEVLEIDALNPQPHHEGGEG